MSSDEQKTYTIYKHTCTINNKSYVGYTYKTMEQRWSEHVNLSNDKRGNEKKFKFQNAIKKYGPENFTHEILFQGQIPVEEACSIEEKMIVEHQSLEPNGYNRTHGGHGVKLTERAREEHRIATKAALNEPEIRARYLAGIRKSHSTPEFLENNRKAQKLCQNKPDVIAKKSKAMKEYVSRPGYQYPMSRRVAQFDLAGNFIAEFKSAREAHNATGCNYTKITEVARGHRNKTGGFKWKYLDSK